MDLFHARESGGRLSMGAVRPALAAQKALPVRGICMNRAQNA